MIDPRMMMMFDPRMEQYHRFPSRPIQRAGYVMGRPEQRRAIDPTSSVRRFDNRAERLANPQGPAQTWGGKAVTNTGFIAPYGRGADRHGFDGCGVCAGLGAESQDQGLPFMGWLLLLGMGATLAYTLLQPRKA
jgi:hypothetical protein